MTVLKLVKKAQKGNDKAFLKLFQSHEEDIYRMAYVYVKNENDALDVVQEVAYKAFKSIHTLKQPQYFKTWLLKITIASAINVIKKNKKVIPLKKEYDGLFREEGKDIPLHLTLHDLIQRLNEDEKSVIILKYYQEHTFQEIAELLDIPLGTTKSLLYRALTKLRDDIKKEDLYE
ncbi:RNA polymerase [Lottiidibacillus patelloidae]|uniref:RNA polymerase n=1 Tax=Lottiidibacillus patelloidae TaxID=2670334 RepID=A0A263BW82_9BACI|nr:sigma-70 family RNA polymerase sigma factor [Lottiidibacillus patelloidae]OZM57975.1 RNA polymerase [Lottiidibacillus patelloidae]